MAPQLGQWRALQIEGFVFVQLTRKLRLTARHQHHVARLLLQTKRQGIVGRGVASVQGGDHVDAFGQGIAQCRFSDRQVQKSHAIKAQALRQRLRRSHQFTACLDAINHAFAQGFEVQVVNDESQIRLACAVIGQGWAGGRIGQFVQDFFDELKQVIHLLELAPRVLIEFALAGQDVQFLEQGQRLTFAQIEI